MAGSKLERDLATQLRGVGIAYRREVTGLVPGRRFRVDFLIPPDLVGECQGGMFVSRKGRRGVGHTSISGMLADIEKLNELTIAGYRVLWVTRKHVDNGKALEWIEMAMRQARQDV